MTDIIATDALQIDPAWLAEPLEYSRRTAKIARYFEATRDGARGVPVSFQVSLTDKCFNRCVMCSHPSRPANSIRAVDWLDFLAVLPVPPESVCYSGGDPLAHPDFNHVMRWHVNRDIPFGLTISGFVPQHIDMDLLSCAAWVRVSLDAVTPEVYEAVRGHTPVAKILAGIDKMLVAGVNVCLGITAHSGNQHDIPNVLAWAASREITDIDVRPVYPDSLEGEPPTDRSIMPFNNCHAALYQLYVDADGSVYPCCITAGDTRATAQGASLGNILRQPWGAIWQSVVAYTKIAVEDLPPICRTCCVQRLSEINHVCGAMQTFSNKSFF